MDFFKKRVYLDFASSTPIDKKMVAGFPHLSESVTTANPSALHKEGQKAKETLEAARRIAASVLFAHPDEVIFTASATESDNIALQGTVKALIAQGVAGEQIAVMTTDIEHAAVLETVKALANDVSIIILPTEHGVLDPKDISVPPDVQALIISVMYVNNEIGTVQDIKAIAKRVRYLRKEHPALTIFFHTDATQAPLHYILNVQKLGIDMMTLGATKLYCPKGVGLLYMRRGLPCMPIFYGGGQEKGLRPGTPAIALIHIFAHAIAYAQERVQSYSKKIQSLQQQFERLLAQHIPQAVITAQTMERTPHLTHIALEKFDSELLVLELDACDIAVSAKSACKNEDANESDIVERIYGKGWGAVRFSFGRTTTAKDLQKAVNALKVTLSKYH